MQAIQIDTIQYVNKNEKYRAFADAYQEVGDPPCTTFDCSMKETCKNTSVDCKAFRFWVNNGKMETKTKNGYVSIERDMKKNMKKL